MSEKTSALERVTTVASAVEQLADVSDSEAIGFDTTDSGIQLTLDVTFDDGEDASSQEEGAQDKTTRDSSQEAGGDGDPTPTELDDDEDARCSCGYSGSLNEVEAHINGKKAHGDDNHEVVGTVEEGDSDDGSTPTESKDEDGDADRPSFSKAEAASSELNEGLDDLLRRSERSFKGKVGSGIGDADDRATLYKFRFGVCDHPGCNQGANGDEAAHCSQHQSKTDDDNSEADEMKRLIEDENMNPIEAAEKLQG